MTANAVCIVDDDDAVRDSLGVFLEACGFAVIDFASALAFLNGGDVGAYRCMLVDVHMPGMNGIELVQLLRDRGVETPVVIITGAADAALRAQAARLSGLTFLDKPIDGDALLSTIGGLGGI